MKQKHAIYPIIMSICALFCFIAIAIWFSQAVQPPWGGIMLLIMPALLLGILAFFAAKGKLTALAIWIWTTVLAVVLFLASALYVPVLTVWTATTTTTDIGYYHRAYAQIGEVDGVKAVFPRAIPADAEDISFTYSPPFLQGGEVFELSYTTTTEKLVEWAERLTGESEWIGSNQAWHTEHNWFLSDADATRYQLLWDGGYNHGEICYVLIDENAGRITFYYSRW